MKVKRFIGVVLLRDTFNLHERAFTLRILIMLIKIMQKVLLVPEEAQNFVKKIQVFLFVRIRMGQLEIMDDSGNDRQVEFAARDLFEEQ